MVFRLLAFVVAVIALLSAPVSAQDISGRASVVDGDTLEVRGVRIRLFGIDAPEGQQLSKRPSEETWRCGQQSALALSERLGQDVIAHFRTAVDGPWTRSAVIDPCFSTGWKSPRLPTIPACVGRDSGRRKLETDGRIRANAPDINVGAIIASGERVVNDPGDCLRSTPERIAVYVKVELTFYSSFRSPPCESSGIS